jgi:hypothetical protein
MASATHGRGLPVSEPSVNIRAMTLAASAIVSDGGRSCRCRQDGECGCYHGQRALLRITGYRSLARAARPMLWLTSRAGRKGRGGLTLDLS